MQISIVSRVDGNFQPIETAAPLPVIPRIGESIIFGSARLSAKVQDVVYVMPMAGDGVLAYVVLDRTPEL